MKNTITINYQEGQNRKGLAAEIAGITGEEKKYLGAPSMAYQVGGLTINREGNIELDSSAGIEELESLVEQLSERGYSLELPEGIAPAAEEAPKPISGLEVSIPQEVLDGPTRGNLADFIAGKDTLIKHALGIEDTAFELDEDNVVFPWFKDRNITPEEGRAYMVFISKLVELAKKLKRVNAKEDKAVPNEKYAFRCLLIRLGLNGKEYKEERKILLSRLSGSSAFRDGKKKEAEDNAVSE